MHKVAFLVALLYQLSIATTAHAQLDNTNIDWLRDIDEARMVAADSERDVFVLFTGRGWCQPCEMLDQLLFHDAEFVSRLQELCVPVELDFNFGDSNSEKVREARFRNWAKRYLVLGYPTMVFMDSNGKPFFVAQYPEGNPADFMARIEKAISRKELRDKLFANAELSDDSKRAQQLHAGILAVAEQLTTIEERHDDPVLSYYVDEVVAIMTTRSSDGELSEIQQYYQNRSDARNEWRHNRRFWDTVSELRKTSNFAKGIELVNKELENESSEERRLSLALTLNDFLVLLERYQEAVTQIDAMLSAEDTDEFTSRRLWRRKVKILYYNADRKPDAYAAVDEWITDSRAGSKALLEALEMKGMMLWQENPASDAAIEVWDAFRAASAPYTFEYLTANAYLARCEHAAGNSQRAADLWDEILSVLERQRDGEVDIRWPWNWDAAPGTMIQAAEVHAAAKNLDAARELLNRAETEIERRAQSDRESNQRDVDSLRERLKAARQSLASTKKNDGEPSDEPKSR